MQVYLLDWLVGSDLDKHSDVRFDDKIKTLYTFLTITRREALDIMECLKAIQKGYDDDSISDNLRGLLSTILDRTLKKITGSES